MTCRLMLGPSFTPESKPLVEVSTKPALAVSSLPAPPPLSTTLAPLPLRVTLLRPRLERFSEAACRFRLPVMLTRPKVWVKLPPMSPARVKLPSRLRVPPVALMVPVLLQVAVPLAACPRLKVPAETLMAPELMRLAVYQVLLAWATFKVPWKSMVSAP